MYFNTDDFPEVRVILQSIIYKTVCNMASTEFHLFRTLIDTNHKINIS